MRLSPKVALTAHRNARLVHGGTPEKRLQNANRLALAAGKPLMRIDLSQVVSKYVGETEKNLDRLFDAAERAGAVLYFDEADALFGKRTGIRDAHDRYASLSAERIQVAARDRDLPLLLGTGLSSQAIASSRAALPLQKARKWPP